MDRTRVDIAPPGGPAADWLVWLVGRNRAPVAAPASGGGMEDQPGISARIERARQVEKVLYWVGWLATWTPSRA